jgi:hypothetical protein
MTDDLMGLAAGMEAATASEWAGSSMPSCPEPSEHVRKEMKP